MNDNTTNVLGDLPEPKYAYEDYGNGQRQAFLMKGKLIFIPELKQWFRYNGKRWVLDEHGDVTKLYSVTLDSIVDEVYVLYEDHLERLNREIPEETRIELKLGVKKPETASEAVYKAIMQRIKDAEDWKLKSQRQSRIKAAIDISKSYDLTVLYKELDSKGLYVGTPSGVISLNKKKVETSPECLVTKSTLVNYNPDATCPEWEKYLLMLMLNDQEKVDFLQLLFGQCLIGKPVKNHVVFFYGGGATGKSTVVDTISLILGDYAGSAKADVLTSSMYSEDYHVAKFKGKRLIIFNEMKQRSVINDNMIKSIVDSGPMVARNPYGSVFEFQPYFTPIINANHQPNLDGADSGNRRRVLLVPFDHTIPKEKRRNDFMSTVLLPEAEGILNWCIKGAYKLIENEYVLEAPDSIQAYTNTFLDEQDRIGNFIREDLVEDSSVRVLLSELFLVYMNWAKDNNQQPLGKIKFRQELERKQILIQQANPDNKNYVYGFNYRDKYVRAANKVFRPTGMKSIANEKFDYDSNEPVFDDALDYETKPTEEEKLNSVIQFSKHRQTEDA